MKEPGALSLLPKRLANEGSLRQLLGRKSAEVVVTEAARAFFIAGLAEISKKRPIVAVTSTASEAERLRDDLLIWLGEDRVCLFPAWETLPFERVSPGTETMGQRIELFRKLKNGNPPEVVVAPIRSMLQKINPDVLDLPITTLRKGDSADLATLATTLVDGGYRREHQVERRGDFAIRGGILDVFPATGQNPIRMDLWGDLIDRLTNFSITDQRSKADVELAKIVPTREIVPSLRLQTRAQRLITEEPWGKEHWERIATGQFFDGMESWLPWLVEEELVIGDLLPKDALVLLIDPKRLRDRSAELTDDEAALAKSLATTWEVPKEGEANTKLPSMHVTYERALRENSSDLWMLTSTRSHSDQAAFDTQAWESPAGGMTRLLKQIRDVSSVRGNQLVVAASGDGSAQRVASTLRSENIEVDVSEDEILESLEKDVVVTASLEYGFIAPEIGLAVLTERDITGRRRTHRVARTRNSAQRTFEDLQTGDFVVHHHHGVAKYSGMEHRRLMGSERDYLVLDFKGSDKLYLPSDQVALIRPYVGGELPSLSRMGGIEFAKQKQRVRSAVSEIAQELVLLYQSRIQSPGHSFPSETPWMRELSDSFVFEETPDQMTAIQEVLNDMESSHPMDRLICGDVGFGKTEVAIRAAFSAVADGKQVAVLVPTTLLAQQHHQTFEERFSSHPVRVEALSRFLTGAQQRKVIQDAAAGTVDVLIGTHRLLSEDVRFKSLGLLIVDEEQRFGVTHKESIKKFKTDIDVLTLSATPIPRTLEMSLTGIRDLSLLQTAPAERQPILTHVGEYDERAVVEAIKRELLREGQVFFVHNRVEDIDAVAQQLRELVPDARVGVAHGQMDEGSLETVVIDFWERSYDVLVCTTIIESGIDMPSVNTLVVDRADLMGLGQLHQLRGRVGRSGQRAYAYLFYPPNRILTEKAHERLKTIGEATQLGSGFRIAMRDLEIRGAGNLLGGAQSGHIAAVGYDLYCEMVTEAVAELKGEPSSRAPEINIDLPIKAFIPSDYVETEEQRLEAYRRLASVSELVEVADIEAEWVDRYGQVPESAKTLLHVALLRSECIRLAIDDINANSRKRVRISPLNLSQGEQVRFRRLSASGSFKSGTFKEESQELTIQVDDITEELPGQLFQFLRELRPAE